MRGSARVYVVDDDSSVRDSLHALLTSAGLRCTTFDSASAYLATTPGDDHACLILDVMLPELSGAELQHQLRVSGRLVPIIFITGYGDLPTAVGLMKAGAMDVLTKPLEPTTLLAAIGTALERAMELARISEAREEAESRFEALTPRDREVLSLVAQGLLNKQIGARLGITERTVKRHRTSIMSRLGIRSTADLVRSADQLAATTATQPADVVRVSSDVVRHGTSSERRSTRVARETSGTRPTTGAFLGTRGRDAPFEGNHSDRAAFGDSS
jgi:FixJ family two-component response regulator